ncbi:hypothetical protein [Candidatus Parabeggiatoa sp. HSG14]|uniref:hypothetical protein n=1 Tax=Candidatus Parabeggiatoa sp. HSG14 TaxID=3055593 RepID=UPI0025A7C610|nr:hypothetical protein [Thiotrichales bacterium HSG14]
MLLFVNHNFIRTVIFVVSLFVMHTPIVYGDELDYQNRGDRWEGIKPQPVSGQDIELLSASVDHSENWKPLPSNCKLKFYLQSAVDIDIEVQELRPKHFYKMDRVIPKTTWQRGFNDFQWLTHDVIAPLNLKMTTLGIVARLAARSDTEHVAPVIFYHATPPTAINGYLFAFKVGGNAKLKYAIYQGKHQTPFIKDNLGRQYVGEPFVVYWDSRKAQAGAYELIVDGYFLNNFKPIHQVVHFYHQPLIKE